MHDRIELVLELKGRKVEITQTGTTVRAAVDHMNDRRIGALVVCDGDAIAGIFTERDVLVRVVARGLDPATTRVSDVMTREPITIGLGTTVNDALVVVTEKRCRHLPVVDATGKLVGLISSGDLTSWIVRDQRLTIDDLHDYIRAV